MPVAKVVTMGWKRITATHSPLKMPQNTPSARPVAMPAATDTPEPPMPSMTETTATFTSDTIAPADKSMSDASTTYVCPTATRIMGRKAATLDTATPVRSRLGWRMALITHSTRNTTTAIR